MSFTNADGISISFDASELIERLKIDIEIFGGDIIVGAKCKKQLGVEIYTDYSLLNEQMEMKKDEYARLMSATALLILFEQENSII